MSNQQRVARAVKDLAQTPFRFWRQTYPERVIGQPVEGLGYHGNFGTIEVVITGNEALRRTTLKASKPYNKPPSIVFYSGDQEIARYSGKMKPVTVTADLDDNETDAVEAFAKEVKLKLKAW